VVENNISRKEGNGEDTHFWKDRWLDDESFSFIFNRLFDLIDTNIMVLLLCVCWGGVLIISRVLCCLRNFVIIG
jgi:hypothetical protein